MREHRLLREPLLHFLLFGLLVQGVAWLRPGPDDPRVIEIEDGLIDDLRRQLGERLERAPNDAEVDEAVEAWIDEELLVREARRRGLHRGDALVRSRLATKMAEVLEAGEAPPEPSEAELRALFERHRDEYRVQERLTVRQLAFASAAEADAALAALRGGGEAEGGVAPPGGPVLRGRSLARLTELFGAQFAAGLDVAPLMQWQRRSSPAHEHVVRVEKRRVARELSFEEARDRLIVRWKQGRLRDAERRARAALRAEAIVRWWPR